MILFFVASAGQTRSTASQIRQVWMIITSFKIRQDQFNEIFIYNLQKIG